MIDARITAYTMENYTQQQYNTTRQSDHDGNINLLPEQTYHDIKFTPNDSSLTQQTLSTPCQKIDDSQKYQPAALSRRVTFVTPGRSPICFQMHSSLDKFPKCAETLPKNKEKTT
eukprot:153715_1